MLSTRSVYNITNIHTPRQIYNTTASFDAPGGRTPSATPFSFLAKPWGTNHDTVPYAKQIRLAGLPSEEAGTAEEVAANTSAVPGSELSKRVAPRARKCFSPAPAKSWRSSISEVFTTQRYNGRGRGGGWGGGPGQPLQILVQKTISFAIRESQVHARQQSSGVRFLQYMP